MPARWTASIRRRGKAVSVVDLFAGVGGFSLGFLGSQNGGSNERGIFQVAALVDVDTAAAYTFKRNHPNIPYLVADVRCLRKDDIARVAGGRPDVVIGGPPCQGFSRLGRRLLNDPRNELVKVFLQLVKKWEVPCVVLENVPHFKHGGLAEECVDLLKRDYEADVRILRAEDYGLPQIRRRAFLVAIRKSLWRNRAVPFPSASDARVTVEEAIGDLPRLEPGDERDPRAYVAEATTSYQRDRRKSQHLLFNHTARRHSYGFLQKISMIPEGGRNLDLPQALRLSDTYFSQAYARLRANGPAYTITASFLNPGSGRFIHYRDRRAITVREAARLQGFDDDFVFHGWSWIQAQHVGNSVPPVLARVWAGTLAASMGLV